VLFFFGGITGIVNASVTMNNVVHNTAWVPGHFHTTVGGPVFLAFLGFSVFLLAQLTGKRLRFPALNLWVPYLWTAGIFIFSFGLSVSGLLGAPRRSNFGPTYANPDSPLFQPGWEIWSQIGAVGGIVMSVSMLFFFLVFFGTLFGKRESEPALTLPTAEAHHDGEARFAVNFAPWVVAAVVLLCIAYVPPLYEILTGPTQGAPAYDPASPVPIGF
jgi:cytochrome c oxidase subunit 1